MRRGAAFGDLASVRMRVLVTGSAGFIGSHVVEALDAAGHEVVKLDLVDGADVRDADEVRRALRGRGRRLPPGGEGRPGPDGRRRAGLRVAQRLSGPRSCWPRWPRRKCGRWSSPRRWWSTARAGTRAPSTAGCSPARAARKTCIAGCFEPPCPICASPLAPGLVGEDAPLDPRNVYAASKVMTEHLAASWARLADGVRAVALRYHNVYGPRLPRDTPYAGVAALFRSALMRGEAPAVFEDGGQRRDFVHVRDVATANVAALEWAAGADGSWRRRHARLQRRQRNAANRRRDGGRTGARDGRSGAGGDRRLPPRGRPAHHRVQRTDPRRSRLAAGRGLRRRDGGVRANPFARLDDGRP